MDITIINTVEDIQYFKEASLPSVCDEFSVDLEGDRLSRHGKINFIQVYAVFTRKVFIFDCSKLDKSEIRRVLEPIFDNESIVKYMFDCRSDVDALYHQYGIKLSGVVDVQLYEIAYRKCTGYGKARFYHGLFKTMSEFKCQAGIPQSDLATKDKYSQQFKLENYELNVKDIDALRYLAIDIIYLDKLYRIFLPKIGNGNMRTKIMRETANRQNYWMKPVFVNDRSNAVSAI